MMRMLLNLPKYFGRVTKQGYNRERGGICINIAPPIIMDLPSQFFSEKRNSPSIYTSAGVA